MRRPVKIQISSGLAFQVQNLIPILVKIAIVCRIHNLVDTARPRRKDKLGGAILKIEKPKGLSCALNSTSIFLIQEKQRHTRIVKVLVCTKIFQIEISRMHLTLLQATCLTQEKQIVTLMEIEINFFLNKRMLSSEYTEA